MRAAPGVARSYARALFALARERGQGEVVARELGAAAELLDREPELAALLARPWVPAGAKRDAAAEVARQLAVSALTRDFLALVAAHGRAGHLGTILAAYRDLADEAAGRARARVRVAVALGDEGRAALARRLGAALDGKQVVLEEVVDRGLLGGFVAEIGSLLVDGSLDGQLARVRERLARG
ncbi:MAG: ATP synthase F1 subunit delta [Candidatus Rokubacteria bacterium RBG_16_73_20]|nr:MAG: ATP synthase F1 subunit delta [Candidatus Rokubacteria bacterium GWA2_73_35]OGK94544.1 MAG: ATP synthase F1 subunit delta [Candidatus Rokubacteria bacterium RBG_16_73_20]HBH00995.1 ATP synthase F1 subunit delta [Candidatus Rokubacteria bacterium]